MITMYPKQLETPIAALEQWGLNSREINILEYHEMMTIRDLVNVDDDYLLGKENVGVGLVNHLKIALRNWYQHYRPRRSSRKSV